MHNTFLWNNAFQVCDFTYYNISIIGTKYHIPICDNSLVAYRYISRAFQKLKVYLTMILVACVTVSAVWVCIGVTLCLTNGGPEAKDYPSLPICHLHWSL